MNTHTASAADHPILPYAQALEREHEEALVGANDRPLVGLLANHSAPMVQTARVVVVRRAAPAEPFGARDR